MVAKAEYDNEFTSQDARNSFAPYLTKKEVASLFRVSPRLVERWMQRKIIPYRRLGRRCVRFNRNAVEKALSKFDVLAMGDEQ